MSTVKKYDKLVRDRIPEIIEADGKTCVCRTLDDAAYLEKLDEKLREELHEYLESKAPEELADLLEVLRAVAVARCGSFEALEAVREEKAQARGGFDRRILLCEVREEETII